MARPARTVPAVVMLAVLASVTGAGAGSLGGEACVQPRVSAGYVKRVDLALRARRDVWGNALLAAPGGPTYERVRRYLTPLLLARGPRGQPLTDSGFHYLAFMQPGAVGGSGSAALHVADGSQIVSKRLRGRALTIGVGRGGSERFGSCLSRLAPRRLADGYLPILETRYVDSQGVRYSQESFATRVSGSTSLVSFLRLTADARIARDDVEIRLVPTETGLSLADNRLVDGDAVHAVLSEGGDLDGSAVAYEIPARTFTTVYAAWLNTPSRMSLPTLDRTSYEAARASLTRYWQGRLTEGATIDVPELRVRDAVRNLLVQNLGLTWRYSIGNPYQQLSFPESLDVAQVLNAYGFAREASSIIRRSLDAPPRPYPSWRIGQKLVATAMHYRLFRDRRFIAEVTPALSRGVDFLGGQLRADRRGLLRPERYSADIPDLVYGLHAQAVVWQGLHGMAEVWAVTGRRKLAARCRELASNLGAGLRRAVRSSRRNLPDGSIFVPVRLLEREGPYDSVTETRSGSYWNLVVPYALASGFFAPRGHEADGLLEYLLHHGSRLLGLVRAGAYSLYGLNARDPVSGVNPVYGLNVSRFLAAADRPDQLVLSLYGQLAAGMAPGTFVAGEAASVAPLPGECYRSMYLPPNGGSNASFLETLRLMLVHETRDRNGAPRGLELAYATPRTWLRPGRRIAVRDLPTSFGRMSFSISSLAHSVRVSIDLPAARPRTLGLRLRLPGGKRMSQVVVNGRPFRRFDRDSETIDLSGLGGHVELVAAGARGGV